MRREYQRPEKLRTGEGVHFHKLTEEQVRTIRHRYHTTEVSQSELARQYGVGRVSMWALLAGRTWKHVPMQNGKEGNGETPVEGYSQENGGDGQLG